MRRINNSYWACPQSIAAEFILRTLDVFRPFKGRRLIVFACALALSTAIARSQSNSFEERVAQAHALLDQGQVATALSQFERLLRERPDAPPALFGKAAALLERGRNAEARKIFDALERIDPSDLGVQMYLARLAMTAGDAGEARRRLAKLRSAAPYSDLLHLQLLEWAFQSGLDELALQQGEFLLKLPLPDAQRARASYLAGLLLLRQGRRDEGLSQLQAAVDHAPTEQAYWTALLATEGASDIADVPAESLERALRLFPDSPELLGLKALREISLERLDEARKIEARLRESDPLQADLLLGRIELESLHFDAAAAAFERVVEKSPADARARRDRGVALARLGRADEALEALRSAFAIDPADAKTLFETARLLTELNRPAEAAAPLEALLKQPNSDSRAAYLMFRVQTMLGHEEEARKWRERFAADR